MYKKSLKSTITLFTLLGILFLGINNPVMADQPRMQAALDALNVAERQLNKASHDKGGHRVQALKLIKKAKKQIKKAIKFDRKN